MAINGVNSSVDYSGLFNSLSSSTSTSSSSGSSSDSSIYSLFTNYENVKSGATLNLAKKYYSKVSSELSDSDEDKKAEINSNKEVLSAASSFKSAADSVTEDKSLFEKKNVTDENGNTTSDYDRKSIYKAVKKFVDGYNSLIESGGDSDNTAILRNTLSITKLALKNENELSKAGITIGEDNKLSVSEESIKDADINSLKSLFSGVGSFAYLTSSSATSVINAANAANNKLGLYNANGSVSSSSTGSLIDGTI